MSVTISVENGIHIIKFNNPRTRNAIHSSSYKEMSSSLKEAANNPEVLMTVFTGEGSYYCSGFDIVSSTTLASDEDPIELSNRAMNDVKSFITSLIDYPKLLIAVVNGPAVGLAVTMLGLCDIVYASERATFQTPFSSLGLCAEGCSSYTFPIILGKSKANEMLLVCHKMTAKEAAKYGLISSVFKDSELSTVWERITQFREIPKESLILSKQMVKKFDLAKLHEANEMEIESLKTCLMSNTFFESVAKFMSKKNKSKL